MGGESGAGEWGGERGRGFLNSLSECCGLGVTEAAEPALGWGDTRAETGVRGRGALPRRGRRAMGCPGRTSLRGVAMVGLGGGICNMERVPMWVNWNSRAASRALIASLTRPRPINVLKNSSTSNCSAATTHSMYLETRAVRASAIDMFMPS